MTEQAVLQDARRYMAMLHKRRGIVLTCLGVSLALAVLHNYTTRPVYQATTQILIDRDTPNVLPNKELVELVQGGMDYYQTQYQLLKGRSLAERAVERLKLRTHPELATGPMMNPWERVRGFFGRPPSAVADPSGIPLSPAAAAFRSRIDVDPLPGSRLVNLRFRAYDPQVAADAVNTLAQLYIEQSLELRFTTSTEATGWLSERLAEQQAKVDAAEKALQEYREREGLVNQEERQGLVEQKLEMLNGAVLDARADRIAKESLYSQIGSQGPGPDRQLPAGARQRAGAGAQGRAGAAAEGRGPARRHAGRPPPGHGPAAHADPLDRGEDPRRDAQRGPRGGERVPHGAREGGPPRGEPRGGQARGPGHEPQVDRARRPQARGGIEPPALPGPADQDQADRSRDRAQDDEHPGGGEGRDAAGAGQPEQGAQLPGGARPRAARRHRPRPRLRAPRQHVQDPRGREGQPRRAVPGDGPRRRGSRRRAPPRAARAPRR